MVKATSVEVISAEATSTEAASIKVVSAEAALAGSATAYAGMYFDTYVVRTFH